MAYSIEVAERVTKVIGKFATLNGYQIAGHVENLDFWVDEIKHALAVIDGYASRHRKMEQAQQRYIQQHSTRIGHKADFQNFREYGDEEPLLHATPDRSEINSQQLTVMRTALVESLHKFLQRLHREQMISAEQAKECLSAIGSGWDVNEFAEN